MSVTLRASFYGTTKRGHNVRSYSFTYRRGGHTGRGRRDSRESNRCEPAGRTPTGRSTDCDGEKRPREPHHRVRADPATDRPRHPVTAHTGEQEPLPDRAGGTAGSDEHIRSDHSSPSTVRWGR